MKPASILERTWMLHIISLAAMRTRGEEPYGRPPIRPLQYGQVIPTAPPLAPKPKK